MLQVSAIKMAKLLGTGSVLVEMEQQDPKGHVVSKTMLKGR